MWKHGVTPDELGAALGRFVSERVDQVRGRAFFDWRHFEHVRPSADSTFRLCDLLESIEVIVIPGFQSVSWTAWAGFSEHPGPVFAEVLAAKHRRLPDQRATHDEVWLLYATDGSSFSRLMSSQQLTELTFSTWFDRLYLLDLGYGPSVFELRTEQLGRGAPA
jgi:hypothetical protein